MNQLNTIYHQIMGLRLKENLSILFRACCLFNTFPSPLTNLVRALLLMSLHHLEKNFQAQQTRRILMKALKCSHSAVAVLQLDLPPPEVVAAAGVDDGVHGAVAPAEPGQHREGQLGLGDAGGADACTIFTSMLW